MTPKIRVLVVDDSVVVRRMVSDIILGDPDLDLAGIAHHGIIALAKIPQTNPDIITLDVDMPEMDGLSTLAELRRRHPEIPVIMLSALTETGARATLDALALGAADYVPKPSSTGPGASDLSAMRETLLAKIKGLCKTRRSHLEARASSPHAWDADTIQVLGIGVSTGGPNALAELIPALPKPLPVPVLIVQHMPAVFTHFLAERLASRSGFDVREARDGEVLQPGQVRIAPGDYHLVVERQGTKVITRLHQGPQENSCRPSVDPLFRSLAQVYGPGTLAVVLTGMGQDGLLGCRIVAGADGTIFAQNEQTSVVWGMPRYVAEEGLADKVLPLAEIAPAITQRLIQKRQDQPLLEMTG